MADFAIEDLYQYWPIGDQEPVHCGPEEPIYYRPATPVDDDDDEEALQLPWRFDIILAGTKRPRSASFEERRAVRRRRVREEANAQRGATHSRSEYVAGNKSENAMQDDLLGAIGCKTASESLDRLADKPKDAPASQIRIPIDTKLARRLSTFGCGSVTAAAKSVNGALGYRDDGIHTMRPTLLVRGEEPVRALPGGHFGRSPDVSSLSLSPGKGTRVEGSDDSDLPSTRRPSKPRPSEPQHSPSHPPYIITPTLPRHLILSQPPTPISRTIFELQNDKSEKPMFKERFSEFMMSCSPEEEREAKRKLQQLGYTVIKNGKKRGSSRSSSDKDDDDAWLRVDEEQCLAELAGRDIYLAEDTVPSHRATRNRRRGGRPLCLAGTEPRRWADPLIPCRRRLVRDVTTKSDGRCSEGARFGEVLRSSKDQISRTKEQIRDTEESIADVADTLRNTPDTTCRRRRGYDSVYDASKVRSRSSSEQGRRSGTSSDATSLPASAPAPARPSFNQDDRGQYQLTVEDAREAPSPSPTCPTSGADTSEAHADGSVSTTESDPTAISVLSEVYVDEQQGRQANLKAKPSTSEPDLPRPPTGPQGGGGAGQSQPFQPSRPLAAPSPPHSPHFGPSILGTPKRKTTAPETTLTRPSPVVATLPTAPMWASCPCEKYSSKAGAAIEYSYRPKSPGIETPEERRARLELGSTRLSEDKKRGIREHFSKPCSLAPPVSSMPAAVTTDVETIDRDKEIAQGLYEEQLEDLQNDSVASL